MSKIMVRQAPLFIVLIVLSSWTAPLLWKFLAALVAGLAIEAARLLYRRVRRGRVRRK